MDEGGHCRFCCVILSAFLHAIHAWNSPFGTALRTWSLPPAVGTLSCMDTTTFGLVCGTTRGHVATFPVESNVPARTRLLSDGQALLHIHAQGVFVAGSFFDATLGKYVVRLVDMNRQYNTFTIYHKTHVLGGGFVRVKSRFSPILFHHIYLSSHRTRTSYRIFEKVSVSLLRRLRFVMGRRRRRAT